MGLTCVNRHRGSGWINLHTAHGNEVRSSAPSCELDQEAMPRHSLPTTDGSSPPQKLQQRTIKFLRFFDLRHVTALFDNNDLGPGNAAAKFLGVVD